MPDATASEIARRLAERFGARRVVLFGSRAAGAARADSDYDLLVVADLPGTRRERNIAVRRALRDLGVALDVLVYTSEEWESHRRRPWTFAHEIERSGLVLHAV